MIKKSGQKALFPSVIICTLLFSAAHGDVPLRTFDRAWLDGFEAMSGRTFTIKPDPDGPPSQRMKVIYNMDDKFIPSDSGKTVQEVFSRSEFRLDAYSVFYSTGSTFTPAPPEFFTIDRDPAGRLGIKRKVIKGEEVPHSGIYLQFADKPGVTHACVSVDMFIPSDFEFGITQGKFGFGMNAGDHPNNGGSTPVETQDGASTRTVRGLGYDTRPYTYALNRVELTGKLYGYQEPSDDAPVPHGEWVRYELEIRINDLGKSNGFVKMWANGVKFSEYSGLVYHTESQPFLLNAIFINDMWQVNNAGQDKVPLKSGHYWYSNYKVMVPGTPGSSTKDWQVDHSLVDFGYRTVGSDSDCVVEFTNTSGGALSGTVTVDNNEYTVVSGSTFTGLADSGTYQVTLRYAPKTTGQHTATLSVSGGEGITVPLTGTGVTLQPTLSFDGNSGTLIAPMADSGTFISTPEKDGGLAVYAITIPQDGSYKIQAVVNAPDEGSNSFLVNFDKTPTAPNDVWDIVGLTSGFETKDVSARGANGTFDSPEYAPAIWDLTAGIHYLEILGRETDTKLQSLTVTLVDTIGIRSTRYSLSPSALIKIVRVGDVIEIGMSPEGFNVWPSVSICNLNGEVVAGPLTHTAGNKYFWSSAGAVNGMYMVKAVWGRKTELKRILLVR